VNENPEFLSDAWLLAIWRGGTPKTQKRQPLKRKILQLTLVAWAAVYVSQQSIQAQGVASGSPGGKADWLPANKTGFGTSHTTLSKVWFTLEGGRLSEVYYPRLDTPSVRNLDFMITDGHSFAARAQDASSSTTHLVGPDHGRRDNQGKPDSLT
jgi:glucoamylase